MKNIIKFATSTKKQLYKGAVICLSALTLSSCNKFLDINPAGELPNDKLLKDAEGFEAALYGAYGLLAKPNLYGEQLSHNLLDLLAQYFECQGNDRVINIQAYNYKHSTVEGNLSAIWGEMYANIANVNNVLNNLERFNPQQFKYYNLYKGEALGLRAFMHFDLLRLFTEHIERNAGASGIPYSTDFKLSPPDFQTASKIYELIIADLKEAESLLIADQDIITAPKANGTDNFIRDRETHFNLYAVQATLARVYFTKGDMPNALTYAEKVINSGKFSLMDAAQVGAGYTRGTLYPTETIFGLYSRSHFLTIQNRFLLQTTRFSFDMRRNFKSYFEAEQVGHDYRWDGYVQLRANAQASDRFVKLLDPYQVNGLEFQRPAELVVGVNMIRLPEMYYIAAEALLDTDTNRAREYFDAVLESRGLVGLADRSPAVPLTVERLAAERYKEFVGEGQTFFNMKRLHQDIFNVNSQNVAADNSIYVLPIPLEETDYRN